MALIRYINFSDNAASTDIVAAVGNNATLLGGDNTSTKQTSSGPGNINYAFDLNGTDDYVSLGSTDVYDIGPGNAFGVSLWFNLDSITGYFLGREASSFRGLFLASNTGISASFSSNGGTFNVPTISTGTWNHLFLTRASNNNCRLWLNGVLSPTILTGTQIFTFDSIGRNANANSYLNGKISKFRFFNTDESGNATLYAQESGISFPTGWSTYWQATPVNAVESLTGFLSYIELSNLSGLGSIANISGADIRVSDENNNLIPCDLMPWYNNGTGLLYLNRYNTTGSKPIRVWAGNPSATFEPATGLYGQYATYDSSVIAFYASGGTNDRTSNLRHLSTGSGEPILQTGKNANYRAHLYNGVNTYLYRSIGLSTFGDTYIAIANSYNDALTRTVFSCSESAAHTTELRWGGATVNDPIQCYVDGAGGGAVTASTSSGYTTGVFYHGSCQSISATNRRVFINGTSSGSNTTTQTPNGPDGITIGAFSDIGVSPGSFFSGQIQSVLINTNVVSTGWLRYDALQLENTDFWGNWTQFSVGGGGGETGIRPLTGVSNSYTESNGFVNLNLDFLSVSNSITAANGDANINLGLFGNSNNYTNSYASPIINLGLFGVGETYTASYASPNFNLSLLGFSEIYTSSDGSVSIQSPNTTTGEFPYGWAGYEEVYIREFPSSATGQVFRVSTTGFSNTWKSTVASDGRDIRVTTANGNRLPVDVVYMENGNGYLEFNLTGLYPRDARERIRFWVGNTNATFEDATGIYGQYSVYPDYLYAYYPTGGGLDRTRNQNHLTGTNITTGQSYAGLRSTLYSASGYSMCNIGITGVPLSLSVYYNTFVTTGNQTLIGLFNSNSTGDCIELRLRGSDDRTLAVVRSNTSTNIVVGDVFDTGVWGQVGGAFAANNNRTVYTYGQNQNSSTTAITGTGINRFGIGAFLGSTISGYSSSSICLAELYTGVKNDAQFLYDYTSPTGKFYSTGWYPAFSPNGWSGYDEVTIVYEASGNLYDQVYLLSTALLSNTLLTVANSSGADLRITKTDNATELPIDVINFNQSQTGMIAFAWPGVKVSGQQDKVRIWAGNPSASKYPDSGVYGKYKVYNTGILGFYPDGGGNDRTQNQRNMTGYNNTAGGLAGPLSGLKATDYTSNGSISVVGVPSNVRRPLNIWSVFWTDITNQNQVVASAGASSVNSRYNNAIRLNITTGVAHHLDVSAGNLEVIAKSGFGISTWYSADAYNDENIGKTIHLNGGNQNSGSLGITFGIANLAIGGYSGTVTPSTGSLLNGRVSLTSFDMSKRYGYEPIYNYEMIFNHPNFYNDVGWTAFSSEGGGGGLSIPLASIVNVFTSSYGRCDVSLSFEAVCLTNTNSFGTANLNFALGGNSNTYTYGFGTLADALQALMGQINANTSASGRLTSTLSLVGGNISTYTYSSGDIRNNVSLAGNTNTRTSGSGALFDSLVQSLIGEINAKTASFGAVVSSVTLTGFDETTSSVRGNIVLSVPLASVANIQTSLQGTLVVPVTDCGIEPSTVEFMVYLTMNAPNPLYIMQNHSDIFYHILE